MKDALTTPETEKVMDALLKLWDWHRRLCNEDYDYGYTDGIGQCILDVGKALGVDKWDVKKQEFVTSYTYEAYKRVMQDTTQEEYWRKYPKPLASYFPKEEIVKHGGKL